MPYVLPPAAVLPGPTESAPINAAVGGAVFAGSNMLSASTGGPEVVGLAGGLLLLFQGLKHIRVYDQHKYAHVTLLVLGLATGVGVLWGIGHQDLVTAITRGCQIAVQSWADYVSVRATGLGGLPPAADPEGG